MADLASSPSPEPGGYEHPIVLPRVDSAAFALSAPIGAPSLGRTPAPATAFARASRLARQAAPRNAGPLADLSTQICWWTCLSVGLACVIAPVVNGGTLVSWIAAVATLAANTALCVTGAVQVAKGERLDVWTGLIAGAGAAFALTQAVRLATMITSATISPSGRLEVIGLFLLSTVYASLAAAGAWIRDLNAKAGNR